MELRTAPQQRVSRTCSVLFSADCAGRSCADQRSERSAARDALAGGCAGALLNLPWRLECLDGRSARPSAARSRRQTWAWPGQYARAGLAGGIARAGGHAGLGWSWRRTRARCAARRRGVLQHGVGRCHVVEVDEERHKAHVRVDAAPVEVRVVPAPPVSVRPPAPLTRLSASPPPSSQRCAPLPCIARRSSRCTSAGGAWCAGRGGSKVRACRCE